MIEALNKLMGKVTSLGRNVEKRKAAPPLPLPISDSDSPKEKGLIQPGLEELRQASEALKNRRQFIGDNYSSYLVAYAEACIDMPPEELDSTLLTAEQALHKAEENIFTQWGKSPLMFAREVTDLIKIARHYQRLNQPQLAQELLHRIVEHGANLYDLRHASNPLEKHTPGFDTTFLRNLGGSIDKIMPLAEVLTKVSQGWMGTEPIYHRAFLLGVVDTAFKPQPHRLTQAGDLANILSAIETNLNQYSTIVDGNEDILYSLEARATLLAYSAELPTNLLLEEVKRITTEKKYISAEDRQLSVVLGLIRGLLITNKPLDAYQLYQTAYLPLVPEGFFHSKTNGQVLFKELVQQLMDQGHYRQARSLLKNPRDWLNLPLLHRLGKNEPLPAQAKAKGPLKTVHSGIAKGKATFVASVLTPFIAGEFNPEGDVGARERTVELMNLLIRQNRRILAWAVLDQALEKETDRETIRYYKGAYYSASALRIARQPRIKPKDLQYLENFIQHGSSKPDEPISQTPETYIELLQVLGEHRHFQTMDRLLSLIPNHKNLKVRLNVVAASFKYHDSLPPQEESEAPLETKLKHDEMTLEELMTTTPTNEKPKNQGQISS